MTNKGGRGKREDKKYVSRSTKAGLEFPVGRIARLLKEGKYADRVGAGTPVYLSAVLEYLTAEVLEAAGDMAKGRKKNRITPTYIKEAMRSDEELDKLLGDVIIPSAAVLPHIHLKLLPKSTGERDKVIGSDSQNF
ncbi:hypothetical protein BUALT_Bualt13G0008600 [Buddleja alternifolia]|uniref:Histone H2A n=1 Tax=Buddleja alternifolia TaxID=168488 RepID=A0AAV6WRI5_9LAMI|nr:hypothetical protein BUALT_Bualt13G0008600 [Buddleja alternifolia]